MTLKVDVILDHYGYYFQKTGLTLKDTNSEFSTARKLEETHGFKIKRKIGTPIHVKKSLNMITRVNSRRVGSSTPERFWKKLLPSYLLLLYLYNIGINFY